MKLQKNCGTAIELRGTAGSESLLIKLKKLEKKKMTKVNGFIPTTLMLITLAFGATAASAGIIVGDRQGAKSSTSTCEEPSTDGFVTSFIRSVATFARTGIIVGDRSGIIVGDRGGIIVGDRTGIIVGDRTAASQETCGIIVGD